MPWGGCCCAGGGGTGTGGIGSLPDCVCTTIPDTLTMVSADPTCNVGMFQSCSITWQSPVPSAFDFFALGDGAFLSTASFPDALHADSQFYYYLSCDDNLFFLTRLYPDYEGLGPLRDVVLYTWDVGDLNTCSSTSLHLDAGTAFSGSDASCSVTIDSA